jgi:hypothetical protein
MDDMRRVKVEGGDAIAAGFDDFPSRLKRCTRVITRMYAHPSVDSTLYANR